MLDKRSFWPFLKTRSWKQGTLFVVFKMLTLIVLFEKVTKRALRLDHFSQLYWVPMISSKASNRRPHLWPFQQVRWASTFVKRQSTSCSRSDIFGKGEKLFAANTVFSLVSRIDDLAQFLKCPPEFAVVFAHFRTSFLTGFSNLVKVAHSGNANFLNRSISRDLDQCICGCCPFYGQTQKKGHKLININHFWKQID